MKKEDLPILIVGIAVFLEVVLIALVLTGVIEITR